MKTSCKELYRLLACFLGVVVLSGYGWTQQPTKEQEYKLALREYAGTYQVDPDRTFIVSLAFKGDLSYIDVASDISSDLIANAKDEFRVEDKPTLVRFVRDERGGIQGLRFTQENAPEIYAHRVFYSENETVIQSGNAQIRGTLIVPNSAVKVAALIIEGGSGWRFAEDMMNYARQAAGHGFASFVWDRRGWGTSTGDKAASFADLAADVGAIAMDLRRNPKIDGRRIGFWGFSQAGWIGTLAASRYENIAFLVLFSPALSFPFRQEEENIIHTLQADGESPGDIREALDFFHAKLEYAMFGSDWHKYESTRQQSSAKPWFRLLDAPQDPSDPEFQFLRLNSHYNSLNALAKVHIPVLALFGEFDTNVSPDNGMSLLEQGLDLAGDRNLRMYLVPNANHSLIGVRSSKPHDFIEPIRYAPGVWSDMWNWLADVVGIDQHK
jgi:pimeloyl-ACP methyl ester carboxylesterase